MSRKGCKAAPAIYASVLKPRGRFAALSRHKAAPTEGAVRVQKTWLSSQYKLPANSIAAGRVSTQAISKLNSVRF